MWGFEPRISEQFAHKILTVWEKSDVVFWIN
jgi:hypothetical protein